MADREERLEEEGPLPPGPARPTPPRPPAPSTSRRDRVRRAMMSAPELRDMVIVQELLLPPVAMRR
ncbi:MAG: hypothetical protein ACLFWM_00700 [Actinomycetota bacterium]